MGLLKETDIIIDTDKTRKLVSLQGRGYVYSLQVRRNNAKLDYHPDLNLKNTTDVSIKIKSDRSESELQLPVPLNYKIRNFLIEAPTTGLDDCRMFAGKLIGIALPISPKLTPLELESFDIQIVNKNEDIKVGDVVASSKSHETSGRSFFTHYSVKLDDNVFIYRGGKGGPIISSNLVEMLALYPGDAVYAIIPKHKQFRP